MEYQLYMLSCHNYPDLKEEYEDLRDRDHLGQDRQHNLFPILFLLHYLKLVANLSEVCPQEPENSRYFPDLMPKLLSMRYFERYRLELISGYHLVLSELRNDRLSNESLRER